MCGFPDKKTRFVLTKNPSHKSRYYNFFLAGIPKRINRLPGCCLVSRIQVKKYTDHQRHGVGDTGHGFHDLWLIHNGKSVFVLLKAFHQELCKRIFCQVQITGTHNCLGKVPFFASADYVFATFFCTGFVCATLKYRTVPAPATQTAATGTITISLLRRRFIFLNLQICYVCSLCFKNTLKEKCIKTLCDLWKPGEKGILFFIYKYK